MAKAKGGRRKVKITGELAEGVWRHDPTRMVQTEIVESSLAMALLDVAIHRIEGLDPSRKGHLEAIGEWRVRHRCVFYEGERVTKNARIAALVHSANLLLYGAFNPP